MVRGYTATDWVFGIVVWLLALFGVGLVIQVSGVLSADVAFGSVVALLAVGGVLLFFVLLFVRYFGAETGRLFRWRSRSVLGRIGSSFGWRSR